MCYGAANKDLVNVSNIGCGTIAKTRAQMYTVAPEKIACFAVFLCHSTCQKKDGLRQGERTHTRTLLRNAHLNTITVAKTCFKF